MGWDSAPIAGALGLLTLRQTSWGEFQGVQGSAMGKARRTRGLKTARVDPPTVALLPLPGPPGLRRPSLGFLGTPPRVVRAAGGKGWVATWHTLLQNRCGETVHNYPLYTEIWPCLSVSMGPAVTRDVPDYGKRAKQKYKAFRDFVRPV